MQHLSSALPRQRCAAARARKPAGRSQPARPGRKCKAHNARAQLQREEERCVVAATRRDLLAAACAGSLALVAAQPQQAQAIQGYTAGRIPGLTSEPDPEGFFTYTRPEGKSGGHGVGWSEVPRYSFRVPAGWEEVPVSIADPGGTEIDLRFGSKDEGSMSVVVAPVLRFTDVGFNADVRLEQLGPPDRIIAGFAPELFGRPLGEEDVLETRVEERGGITYYLWHLKPHKLVAATAMRNRLFLLSVVANSRQWKKHEGALRTIQQSFTVPDFVVPPAKE